MIIDGPQRAELVLIGLKIKVWLTDVFDRYRLRCHAEPSAD